MDILISFCNTSEVSNLPNLGIWNTETNHFSVIDIPKEIPLTGMVGMAVSSQFFYIGLQHELDGKDTFESPPLLLIFDKRNFQLLYQYRFLLARDLHSFLLLPGENELLVASTGTDEIISLKLDGFRVISEKIFFKMGGDERCDQHHLNSLVMWHGDIYVSGFGLKEEGNDWGTARNGFILNLKNNEKIIEGIEHPHSLTVIAGRLAFCESRKKQLRFVEFPTTVNLSGYTRGLCVNGEDIFIATSTQRKKSKSTGKVLAPDENHNVGCTLSKIRIGSSVFEMVDLNPFGYEIYDLLPVEKTSSWPISEAIQYRILYEQSWLKRFENVTEEIHYAVPKHETILFVDNELLVNADLVFSEYRCLPFLEKNGVAWGSPPNEDVALMELKRMREEMNAGFIAIAWPSFWWFDVYPGLTQYLRENFESVVENDDVIVFKLMDKTLESLEEKEILNVILHE